MLEQSSSREEWLNALTHGAGAVLSVLAGGVLIGLALRAEDGWLLLGTAIYAAALVLLYFASTLYHAVRHHAVKARLRVLDHCAIYLLIAGTYTPFALGALRGAWGWTLLAVVWSLAVAGIVYKLFLLGRFPRLSTAMYLGMGWIAVLSLPAMVRLLSPATLVWLLLGGLAYSAGTLFFHSRRIPYAHAIWHGFVMAGSTFHFVAVLTQVLPGAVA
jgi:hemolysin III